MSSSRRFKFEISQNKTGKYKVKNGFTGGTLRATFDSISDAKAFIKAKVEGIKNDQRAGRKSPKDKS